MILLTVGSQVPFDRLTMAMDRWAQDHPEHRVVAQIGDSAIRPSAMQAQALYRPAEFAELIRTSNLVVAHAGMGTVLTALDAGRPLVLLPRRGSLMETRNDHQVASVKWLASIPGVQVAMDESELDAAIERALAATEAPEKVGQGAAGFTLRLRQMLASLVEDRT